MPRHANGRNRYILQYWKITVSHISPLSTLCHHKTQHVNNKLALFAYHMFNIYKNYNYMYTLGLLYLLIFIFHCRYILCYFAFHEINHVDWWISNWGGIFRLNYFIFFTLTSKGSTTHLFLKLDLHANKTCVRVSWSGYREMSTTSRLSNLYGTHFLCDKEKIIKIMIIY